METTDFPEELATQGIRPFERAWAAGGAIVAALAAFKLAIHLATTGAFGYGFFVDELYFLACSRHLDWGYVDMPPLFPILTAAVRHVFGESLLAIRLMPALAGAGMVFLTGLLARDLGGGRLARGLSALAVVTAPIYLVLNSIHTMNELEPLLWTGCAILLVRLNQGADPRLWIAFGAIAGIGLLNKHSMAFFGVAAVLGLLASPERRVFRQRWIWAGGAVAFLLFLPNLIWMVKHHFPHLEMLANIRRNGRDVALNPLQFLGEQVLMLNPIALPLWLAGLWWLLADKEGRRFRTLGFTYLGVIGLLLVLNGRVYYAAPVYPILLAAGGVALERWLMARRWRLAGPAFAAALVASGAVLAPFALPCLPPETFIRYAKALALSAPPIENHRLGPLPQLLADRFGWKEMAEVVARVYHGLPAEERAKAAIFGQNYGQAGAIDLYGEELGLPKAISGHLTYWYWGPRECTGEVMIVLGDRREVLERLFDSVKLAGHVTHPYSMPYQHFDVFVCRKPRGFSLAKAWPQLKKWD